MQAVRELDDDDRALAGRTQKASYDGSTRLAANFAKHNVHISKLAHLRPPAKLTRKNPAFLRTSDVRPISQRLHWSKGGTVSALSVRLWPPRAIIHSLDWTEEATQFVAGKCLDNPTLLITFS